jgi:uncharacterized protein YlxP (DUF503 family)
MVNPIKVILGASVAVNVVLGVAFVRNQRKEHERVLAEIARIRQEIATTESLDNALKMAEGALNLARQNRQMVEQTNERMKLSSLRSTAFLDQHDAWVEENLGHVHEG